MKLATKPLQLLDSTDQFLDMFRRRFHPGMIYTFEDATLNKDCGFGMFFHDEVSRAMEEDMTARGVNFPRTQVEIVTRKQTATGSTATRLGAMHRDQITNLLFQQTRFAALRIVIVVTHLPAGDLRSTTLTGIEVIDVYRDLEVYTSMTRLYAHARATLIKNPNHTDKILDPGGSGLFFEKSRKSNTWGMRMPLKGIRRHTGTSFLNNHPLFEFEVS